MEVQAYEPQPTVNSEEPIIEKTTASGTVTAFPVYDGHGNMVATLSRSLDGFAVNDRRSFDAWGAIRTGATTGDPKGRYVANLGHVQDDESGLVYMRARYYEALSGRFVSQDRAHHGFNWFVYCGSNPISFVDESGQESTPEFRQFVRLMALAGASACMINAYFAAFNATEAVTPTQLMLAYTQSLEAVTIMAIALVYTTGPIADNLDLGLILALAGWMFGWLLVSLEAAALGGKGIARGAVGLCFGYSLIIAGFLLADVLENTP